MLEKKCFTGMEKLKVRFGDHLQDGISISHILDKTKSILTLRKPLLLNNGYSKCSRYISCLFTDTEEDLVPLCSTNRKVLWGLWKALLHVDVSHIWSVKTSLQLTIMTWSPQQDGAWEEKKRSPSILKKAWCAAIMSLPIITSEHRR